MSDKRSETIRILIADDHKIFRQGLKSILQQKENIEVVGEAENGDNAVDLCAELTPDVAVLDITMPDMSGLVAAKMIQKVCEGTRILILSTHLQERFIVQALKAGANGYVLKSSGLEELVSAIETVHDGVPI